MASLKISANIAQSACSHWQMLVCGHHRAQCGCPCPPAARRSTDRIPAPPLDSSMQSVSIQSFWFAFTAQSEGGSAVTHGRRVQEGVCVCVCHRFKWDTHLDYVHTRQIDPPPRLDNKLQYSQLHCADRVLVSPGLCIGVCVRGPLAMTR